MEAAGDTNAKASGEAEPMEQDESPDTSQKPDEQADKEESGDISDAANSSGEQNDDKKGDLPDPEVVKPDPEVVKPDPEVVKAVPEVVNADPEVVKAGPEPAGEQCENKDEKEGDSPAKEVVGAENNDREPSEKPPMKKTDSQAMAAIDRQEETVDVKDIEWPTTLEGFKYEFNKDGEFRHMETKEPFQFKIKEEHSYNQKRYETIGDILTDYIYQLLEDECKLKRTYLPVNAKDGDPRSFIFESEDARTNPEKLMLLIHGSGVVRAGQWARRLIMNENLEKGTQISYIKKAVEQGYGVIVLNTNLNYAEEDGIRIPIKHNDSPESHALYVWQHIVSKAAAQHIAIVAHSYGGVVTSELAIRKEREFLKRVFAIGFTDSVHSLPLHDAPSSVIKAFKKRGKNWVSSQEDRDTVISTPKHDSPLVSAGHPKHEWTSWSAIDSVFEFISEKYTKAIVPEQKEEL